jgi:type I restriction enzyme S subunit
VEEAKEEWEYQLTLGDLIESVSITHKFPNNMIVFLNTSDIYLGNVIEHNLSLVKGLPGQAKKSIQKGDILFSEIRPANGRWAYIDFDAANYVVSTKLMVLRSKNILSQEFIYFYLTNRSTVDWLQLIAESRSGTFPQITFDQIKDLKINIPSETVLKDSIIWCESALKKIHSNQTQIRTLTAIRNNLLPKLMSGEVLVKM